MYALQRCDRHSRLHSADCLLHHVQKLAAGSDAILLDVTMGDGAFMKGSGRCPELARQMVAIGTAHGRKVAALITDMDKPSATTSAIRWKWPRAWPFCRAKARSI